MIFILLMLEWLSLHRGWFFSCATRLHEEEVFRSKRANVIFNRLFEFQFNLFELGYQQLLVGHDFAGLLASDQLLKGLDLEAESFLALNPLTPFGVDPVIKQLLGFAVALDGQAAIVELEVAHGLEAGKHGLKAVELGNPEGLRLGGVGV